MIRCLCVSYQQVSVTVTATTTHQTGRSRSKASCRPNLPSRPQLSSPPVLVRTPTSFYSLPQDASYKPGQTSLPLPQLCPSHHARSRHIRLKASTNSAKPHPLGDASPVSSSSSAGPTRANTPDLEQHPDLRAVSDREEDVLFFGGAEILDNDNDNDGEEEGPSVPSSSERGGAVQGPLTIMETLVRVERASEVAEAVVEGMSAAYLLTYSLIPLLPPSAYLMRPLLTSFVPC